MLYEPDVPSGIDSIPALIEFMVRENRRIALTLALTVENPLTERHTPPAKLREFLIVAADGTDWNPGSGKGVYAYYSGAWNKLG